MILPQNLISIIVICIILGILIFAYLKKIMMTYALIIANFVVFVISLFYFEELISGSPYNAPIELMDYVGLAFRPVYLSVEQLPQLYTLFTSMFLHGGFLHVIGNMIIFLFMGMAFEHRIGMKNFIAIYLITCVCGALTH